MVYKWREATTREAVKGRSGGICESCSAARATDMHHRIARSVGGKWSPANIMHICRACHTWITDDKPSGKAADHGYTLRSHEDPERVPVRRLIGETLYLSDDVCPPLGT